MPRLRQIALVACGAGLLLAALLVSLPPHRVEGRLAPPPTHLAGILHVHTIRSDGSGTIDEIAAAAARAGLQFVIFTDHGDATRPPAPPAYRSGVLCLDAVEISSRDGHYIAIDMDAAPYPLGGEARDVVDDVRRLGGFGVAAHPDSTKTELQWRYRSLPVDALEWINADSEWRNEPYARLIGPLLSYALRPAETLVTLLDRPTDSLARWDERASHHTVVGLAGTDAHASLVIPSYEASFRTFSQRVILDAPPTGDAARDADQVYRALRAGQTYTVISGLASVGRVEFRARTDSASATMGHHLRSPGPITIVAHVEAPTTTELVLIADGLPVHRTEGPEFIVELETRPASVRLEAYLPGAPGDLPVPWIVGNPIYFNDQRRPELPVESLPANRTPPGTPLGPEGWTTEHAIGSTPALVRLANETRIGLQFTLGRASNAAPYVALHHALDSDRPVPTHMTLRAWSTQPRRLSVQLRADGPPERRWQRSIYVDETPRTYVIDTHDLRDVKSAQPTDGPGRVNSLLIVVDTVNAREGASGTFWIDDVAIQQAGTGD